MAATRFCRLLLAVSASVVLAGCGDDGGGGAQFDQYGGWTGVAGRATGSFRVEEIDGVWWFITPEGHGFFSLGVDHLLPEGDFSPPLGRSPYQDNILARYGSELGRACTRYSSAARPASSGSGNSTPLRPLPRTRTVPAPQSISSRRIATISPARRPSRPRNKTTA